MLCRDRSTNITWRFFPHVHSIYLTFYMILLFSDGFFCGFLMLHKAYCHYRQLNTKTLRSSVEIFPFSQHDLELTGATVDQCFIPLPSQLGLEGVTCTGTCSRLHSRGDTQSCNTTIAGGRKLLSRAGHTRGGCWGWLIPHINAQGRVAAAWGCWALCYV